MKIDTMLWVVQFILALKFLTLAITHGLQHNKPTMQQAIQRMGPFIRPWLGIIAILMLLCAVGLVLPAFVNGLAWLAPLSAAVLTVMLAISFFLHIKSRTTPLIFTDFVILALCAFVVYGRGVLL